MADLHGLPGKPGGRLGREQRLSAPPGALLLGHWLVTPQFPGETYCAP